MTIETTATSSDLYEKDYDLWLEETIQELRQGRFHEIDLTNLIIELEGMSRSQKRAVYSNLKILLMHLLKYRYQPSKRSRSWLSTIEEHRQRIEEAFSDSPSLERYCAEVFDECYLKAVRLAVKETGLSRQAFPETSPFSLDETLNPEYLPE